MRILSLDGGGARGMLTLSVLCHVEEQQGAPISKLFDLIVGSSVGGIIALLLTRPQALSARATSNLFASLLPDIFARKGWNMFGPKYDGTVLQRYCEEYLDAPAREHAPFAVTSYDTHMSMPIAFTNRRQATDDDYDSPAWLCAMATSAAPTYFPPLQARYIDGGVVANNPSIVAVMQAHSIAPINEPLHLLSIGTGVPAHSFDAQSWGQAQWISKIVDVMMDGEAALQHMLAPSFVDSYLRVQPSLPRDIPMDAADGNTLNLLQSLGRAAYEADAAALRQFFDSDATISKSRRGSLDGPSKATAADMPPTGGG